MEIYEGKTDRAIEFAYKNAELWENRIQTNSNDRDYVLGQKRIIQKSTLFRQAGRC